MKLDDVLYKLHKKIVARQHEDGNYTPDLCKWRSFLNKIGNSKSDDITLSHNKFLCRMTYFSFTRKFILNFFSFFAFLMTIPFFLFPLKAKSMRNHILVLEKDNYVPVNDIIPGKLKEEYRIIYVENINKYFGRISNELKKKYLKCIARYPFEFYYLFFIYKEFVAHSYILSKYNPDAVAVYVNERNVASPILTDEYEMQGRKLISFMHGEYLLQLIQAFSCFSEYYVWDEMYIDMFKNDLRWKVGKYIVYKPKKLQRKWDLSNNNPEYDYTYYLCDANNVLIDDVTRVMNLLSERGVRCKIRPHPREREFDEYLRKKSGKVDIEDIDTISLEDSFRNTRFVVGLKSTSLYEAFSEGKTIIIDDVSSPQRFKSLSERKCRLLSMNHQLLSYVLSKKLEEKINA